MWLEQREGESGRKGGQGGDGGQIRQDLIGYGKEVGFYFEGGRDDVGFRTIVEVGLGVRSK